MFTLNSTVKLFFHVTQGRVFSGFDYLLVESGTFLELQEKPVAGNRAGLEVE